MSNENLLINEDVPTLTRIWRRTTALQKVFMAIIIITLIFYAYGSRLVPNTHLVEACNADGTVCQDKPVVTILPDSLIPSNPISVAKVGFLGFLFAGLVYAFMMEKKYGNIDMDAALLLSQQECDRLVESGFKGTLTINKYARRQDKFYADGKYVNKWFVGVNRYLNSGYTYYIMTIDAVTGDILGLEKTYDGKEFDGKDVYDEKVTFPPWVADYKHSSEALGYSAPPTFHKPIDRGGK